ncbi:MAG: hypothetical protein OXE96_05910, partial [Gemmatimonadetes bacterium]|nr:hypothetical protein [Gemmatimonadota bacterium]
RLHTLTSTFNPHTQRPYGPPLLQGDRHRLESAIGLAESVVGIAGMGSRPQFRRGDAPRMQAELR